MTTPRDIVSDPPYPWFGGKSQVADLVWQRFGDVPNYVEPFFGGGAVWRLRPHWPFDESVIRRETINDYDGHVANFWRAVQANPDAVAKHLDWPVSELDLHARGDWLYTRPESKAFVEQMRADADFFCAKTAGWWCWFVANWIGGLPSTEKNSHRSEDAVYRKLPHLVGAGKGVSRQLPHLGRAGKGVSRQRPHLGDAGMGVCERASEALLVWMRTLADRLRHVRVCCGDWNRVLGPSVTWNNAAPCAVFFDPPYSAAAGRDNDLYSEENLSVAHDVRAWCLEHGENRDLRICLAGYEGEGHDDLVDHGWQVVAWKANGGYCKQGKDTAGAVNCHRERLWFSPGCVVPVVEKQKELWSER